MNYPAERDLFADWLNDHNLLGEGVEVGAAFGNYSRIILSKWKGKRLFMVDPWKKQDPNIYKEDTNKNTDFERWYQQCQELAASDPRATLIRKLSVDASRDFSDGQFDFVYLDGNHSYSAVLDDMDAWWPKVKQGGMFCGHDFYDWTTPPYWNEVKSAVTRWHTEHKVEMFHSLPCSSWWIPK
jgi:hypothetical protein